MPAKYTYQGTGKPRSLILSDLDAIWAMRMCVGEGGRDCSREKASAMLWAMCQRYLLMPARFWRRPLWKLLRAFSQPINPAWMAGGKFILRYLAAPLRWVRTAEAVSPKRLARRAHICSLTISQIPDQIRLAVEDFQRGNLPVPGAWVTLYKYRVSNWASLPSTPKKYPWGIDVDGDWFFEDKKLLPGEIEVEA